MDETMTAELVGFTFIVLGLGFTSLLFYRLPIIPSNQSNLGDNPTLTVIIPARNEEETLPLLLGDLRSQSITDFEIICVDDNSEDGTARVASTSGVELISLAGKPDGWIGKSWACHNGAVAAKGDVLLFLDADVRLSPDGLFKLLRTFVDAGCAISVQPFHVTKAKYEQFSLFFNLVQIAANGIALPKPLDVGLFGPMIMIPRQEYFSVGGHNAIKSSVIEDIALGMKLRQAGVAYRLFIGDESLTFRMYAGGIDDLLQGWTKSLASGAAKTPFLLFIMVFLWVTSLTSVPVHLIGAISSFSITRMAIHVGLYIIWVIILMHLSRRIGRFQRWALLLYPVPLCVFLVIFSVSMFKKIFKQKVIWKGRQIETADRR